MRQTLCQNYSTQELHQQCSLAVASLASVPPGCVELIASQFQSQGQKYGLLTKCEVKMAGYWPSSFLRVYGPRRSRGP